MDDLVGLCLEDALEKVGGEYKIKLIEIESAKIKYTKKRVVHIKMVDKEEHPCMEIIFACFPVLSD